MKNPFNSIVLVSGECVSPTRQKFIGILLTIEDPVGKEVELSLVWNTTGVGPGSILEPCIPSFKENELDHFIMIFRNYARDLDGEVCQSSDSVLTLTLSKKNGVFQYEHTISLTDERRQQNFHAKGQVSLGGLQAVRALNDFFSYKQTI